MIKMNYKQLMKTINTRSNYLKYLWLYCKNRDLVIKDRYFTDVFNGNIIIKPAFSDSSRWSDLNIEEGIIYLEGMIAGHTSITMKNL